MRYKNEDLVDDYLLQALEYIQADAPLQALVNKIFIIDELYTHSANVAKLGVQLGLDVEMPEEMVHKICLAGVLHDAGKIFTPKEILFKPGKLSDEEFAIIKKHSEDGAMACAAVGVEDDVLEIIMNHHEKYGGGGYPRNVERVSPQCSIITVADIFSALIEPRLYHRERTIMDALNFIATFDGLDKDLVQRLHGLVTM